MTKAPAQTKADLQDQLDRAIETLDEVYAPESTREELAEGIGQALNILRGEDLDADDSDDDEIDEEDDDLD